MENNAQVGVSGCGTTEHGGLSHAVADMLPGGFWGRAMRKPNTHVRSPLSELAEIVVHISARVAGQLRLQNQSLPHVHACRMREIGGVPQHIVQPFPNLSAATSCGSNVIVPGLSEFSEYVLHAFCHSAIASAHKTSCSWWPPTCRCATPGSGRTDPARYRLPGATANGSLRMAGKLSASPEAVAAANARSAKTTPPTHVVSATIKRGALESRAKSLKCALVIDSSLLLGLTGTTTDITAVGGDVGRAESAQDGYGSPILPETNQGVSP